MEWDDDIASRLIAAITALPEEQQPDAVHALLNPLIKQLPLEPLLELRADIADRFEEDDLDVVRTTVDLIDGQVALRTIAGAEIWR